MTRRHNQNNPNNTEQYNIITGGSNDKQPTPKYDKLESKRNAGSVIFPENETTSAPSNRFETTSGMMSKEQGSSPRRRDNSTPYYGRQKKTNEFYSKTGVFSKNDSESSEKHPLGKSVDTKPNAESSGKKVEDPTKYSRYY